MSRFSGSRLCALLFGAALFVALPSAFADADHASQASESVTFEHVPGATALEGRIIAPCCWNQTIDIHGSPASTALRVEIRKRLKNGETPEAIQQSLVDRYGEKILAVKSGSKLGSTGILLAIAMGAMGVFAITLLRRWRDRSHLPPNDKDRPESPATQALDARVDAELAALDRD